jgi:flagellin-like protein
MKFKKRLFTLRLSSKIKRNIRALSPVISVLLMIAITVVASLVAYAWIGGYLNFITGRSGNALQIQSAAIDFETNKLIVYVQNTGQSIATLGSDSIYVNDALKKINKIGDSQNPIYPFGLPVGNTIKITVDYVAAQSEKAKVKVTATDGTFSEAQFTLTLINTVQAPKTVYVAICVDTEFTNGEGNTFDGHNIVLDAESPEHTDPHPTLYLNEYDNTGQYSDVANVFNSAFRSSHIDSDGNPFKVTWLTEMDYLISQANFVWSDGTSTGVSGYTAISDILMKNWGSQIETYGDSIDYHHHVIVYEDGAWKFPSSDVGVDYNYQADAVSHMIIDEELYPSVYRAGWNTMSPGLSSWLEEYIPYDYTSLSSAGSWYPTHPSGMDRWIISSQERTSQEGVNSAFDSAKANGASIYSFWCHDREDMAGLIDDMQTYLNNAVSNPEYSGVTFKYVTAVEAMQKVLKLTDTADPSFEVTSNQNGGYTITSNEAIWNDSPFVALKYVDGSYLQVHATSVGNNQWSFALPTGVETETSRMTLVQSSGGLHVVSATASSYSNRPPEQAIDGDDSLFSFWDSTPGSMTDEPQWLQLDLGSAKTFSNIRTHFYDYDGRTYRYSIETSTDGSHWNSLVSEKSGTGVVWENFAAVTARYVKINVLDNTANSYAHIVEVTIGSTPPSVSASSSEAFHIPELAVDGNEFEYNYWRSNPSNNLPQWFTLDFKSVTSFNKIKLQFGDSNTYTYALSTSTDGTIWSSISQGSGSGTSVISLDHSVTARYLKITITGNSGGNYAQIGEVSVYQVSVTQPSSIEAIGVAASDLAGNTGVKVIR